LSKIREPFWPHSSVEHPPLDHPSVNMKYFWDQKRSILGCVSEINKIPWRKI
jgi:hypothetical protein